MKYVFYVVVAVLLIGSGILAYQLYQLSGGRIEPAKKTKNIGTPKKISNTPPPMTIDTKKTYIATLRTDAGNIEILLTASETPVTVNNFVTLAQKGFYNQTVFHRVIRGFMIQGGDPVGNGTGGPGYTFDDEPFTGEYQRGTVAMANRGPNTNGSQFFIMQEADNLPKDYVIFGNVINGIEVVDTIANADVTMSGSGEKSKPVNPVSIKSIDISTK